MTKRHPDKLFEAIRQMPPELSQERVTKMIMTLPLLPAPAPIPTTGGTWSQFLTFNPLIMNSIVISLVVGVAVLLPNKDESHLASETEKQVPAIQEVIPAPEQLASPQAPVPVFSPPQEIKVQQEMPEPVSASPSPILQVLPDEIPSLPIDQETSSEVSTDPVPALSPISFPHIQQMPNYINPALANLSTSPAIDIPHLSGMETKKLKRQLLSMLKDDELIRSKREFIKIQLFPNLTRINHLILTNRIEKKYLRFFEREGIYPDWGRYVILHPKCIMIGNFEGDGFRGMAHGTIDDDIQEYLDRITPVASQSESHTGIFAPSEGEPLSVLAAPAHPSAGTILAAPVKISGQVIDPIVDLGSVDVIPFVEPDLDIEGQVVLPESIFPDEAVLIGPTGGRLAIGQEPLVLATPSDPDNTLIIGTSTVRGESKNGLMAPPLRSIEGNIWAQLKAELIENLMWDGLISHASTPIKLMYPGNQIIVNHRQLSPDLFRKYQDILHKYPIKSGPKSEIHITKKFLLAGEFDKDGYLLRGHGHGEQEVDEDRGIIGIQEQEEY